MERLYLTALGEQELERLRAGRVGPYELRQTFLPHSRRVEAANLHRLPSSSVAGVPTSFPTRNPPSCVPTAGNRSISGPPIAPCWM